MTVFYEGQVAAAGDGFTLTVTISHHDHYWTSPPVAVPGADITQASGNSAEILRKLARALNPGQEVIMP